MSYYIQQGELYHFGILGMKWGVRRYQKRDGTLTKAGKERYDKLERKTAQIKSNINIRNGDTTVLKKGTTLLRVTSQKESVDDRVKYATLKDETGDYGNYADSFVWDYNNGDKSKLPLLETYETKKNLKVVTGEQIVNELLDKYGDEPASKYGVGTDHPIGKNNVNDIIRSDLGRIKIRDLISEMDDLNDVWRSNKYEYDDKVDRMMLARAQAGREAVRRFMGRHFDRNDEALERYRKAGYDAVADVMDISQGFSRQPIIILDPKRSLKKISSKTIKQYDNFRNPKGDFGLH